MPYLNVKLSNTVTDTVAKDVATTLTRITAEILKKKPELTSVAVEHVPATRWFIAANTVSNGTDATFYLDIKVTEGTNTKDEKARYIEKVFAAMQAILGALHPASYVVIHEVRADAWGYQGATQEFRYIKATSL